MRRTCATSPLRWAPVAGVLACTLALSPVAGARNQGLDKRPNQVMLEVRFATANSMVPVALNSGKIADTKIGADGMGASPLDLASLGKARVDVYIRVCKDGRTQVLLFTGGGVPPKDERCNDKPVGAFWSDKTTHLLVNLQSLTMTSSGGGNFFMTPLGLTLIGGGTTGVLLVALNGDGDDGPYGGGGTTPTPMSYNGRFTGNATKGNDTCALGFSQTAPISAELNVNDSGSGTWRKTHLSASVTFNFNVTLIMNAVGATFTSTTSQSIGGTPFSITDSASFTGATVTVTQRFVRTSGASCEINYSMTLTRAQAAP